MERSDKSQASQEKKTQKAIELIPRIIKARVFYIADHSQVALCKNKDTFYMYNYKGESPDIGDVIAFSKNYARFSKIDMPEMLSFQVSKTANFIKARAFVEQWLPKFHLDASLETLEKVGENSYNFTLSLEGEVELNQSLKKLNEQFSPENIHTESVVDIDAGTNEVTSFLLFHLSRAKLS